MNINDELKILDYTVPEFYLPYLINGDSSGLNEQEVTAVNQWYDHEFGNVIGHFSFDNDIESSFHWRHDLSSYGILACECVDIQFVVMGHSS